MKKIGIKKLLTLLSIMAILSACESSEKNLLELKGLNGMTASFRKSGVKSIMVSMWPVDEFSSKLVPRFYKLYRQCNNIPASLKKAKLKLISHTEILKNKIKVSFSHPFLWSNYILYNFSFKNR